MKYAILCSFVLGTASVAYGQSRMPPPTYNGNNNSSSSGWDNPQTRSPMTGADPADRVGTFQIMLQAPALVTDTLQVQRGLGLISQGTLEGYFGLSGGVGYTLSSLFEIGGGLRVGIVGADGGTDFDFQIEPFIKLNLGPTFKTGALNPFVLAGLMVGVQSVSVGNGLGGSASTTNGDLWIDIDPGLEWLVGGRWGFDFYIPVNIGIPLSGGDVRLLLGIGYGLVVYI